MTFRPRLIPTLVTVPVLALLAGLGIWQLERQQWKSALIAELQSRLAAPPLEVSRLADAEAGEVRYRRVEVSGKPVAGPFLLRGRTRDGEVGAHVLELYAPADGAALIVDHGWVPYGDDGKPVAYRRAPPGPVLGLVREAGWQGFEFLRPAHQPEANAWLYVDPHALASAAGYDEAVIERFYVSAVARADRVGPPFAQMPEVRLPDNHLQYAITWFAVAAGVLVIYVVWHFRQPRSRDHEQP